ncbi:hypothetical protein WDH52_09180 [Streptomyces sp. TRM70308]|uniref:hypothetical protein n=1 Tax=Streptomyces sp. TRM70308 TaxID=3131932 RepID=UPI003CFD7195
MAGQGTRRGAALAVAAVVAAALALALRRRPERAATAGTPPAAPPPLEYRHPRRGRLYASAVLVCCVGAAGWAGCAATDSAHGADRPLSATAWLSGALLPLLLHRAGARTVLDSGGLWTRGGLAPRPHRVAWPQVREVTTDLAHRPDGAVHRIVVVRADGRHVPLAVPQTRAWRPDGAAVLHTEHARVVAHWQAATRAHAAQPPTPGPSPTRPDPPR